MRRDRSDRDEFEVGIETVQILRIAGDDPLATTSGADHDMSVGDICGTAGGEQSPDVGGVDPIQGDDVGLGLTDQPGEAGCRSGRRIACARALAGTVMRAPTSAARVSSTITRRSSRYNLTPYDAAYVVLARRTGTTLLTLTRGRGATEPNACRPPSSTTYTPRRARPGYWS